MKIRAMRIMGEDIRAEKMNKYMLFGESSRSELVKCVENIGINLAILFLNVCCV